MVFLYIYLILRIGFCLQSSLGACQLKVSTGFQFRPGITRENPEMIIHSSSGNTYQALELMK